MNLGSLSWFNRNGPYRLSLATLYRLRTMLSAGLNPLRECVLKRTAQREHMPASSKHELQQPLLVYLILSNPNELNYGRMLIVVCRPQRLAGTSLLSFPETCLDRRSRIPLCFRPPLRGSKIGLTSMPTDDTTKGAADDDNTLGMQLSFHLNSLFFALGPPTATVLLSRLMTVCLGGLIQTTQYVLQSHLTTECYKPRSQNRYRE